MGAGLLASANIGQIAGSIGGLVGGVGGILEGRQQEQMGKYNAAIYEQQARAERTSQALLESQKRRIIKSELGAQKAQYARSGIRFSGSPVEVALDSLINAEMDLAIDKYNSEVKARGFESSAAMSRYEGRQGKAMSYVRSGKSLLSTTADLYRSQREIGGGKRA